ncbi:GNAT family N-acetyltransferase [Aquibacillus kalidii]|uniref:GNAT family N-acetyltransferase n=1 Tax=Aquibacillus kalidii TaxID=2762597 RepID=UPI001648766E|nr:GNAT family N-acetyltransferase [Aquibacillus kalidii]
MEQKFDRATTDRLLLRRPRQEDAPSVFQIESDPRTNQFRPAGPMKNIGEATENINAWQAEWDTYGFSYWIVTLPNNPTVIGIGGIRCIRWKERYILNLYYRFSPTVWGNEYASELAKFAVDLGSNHLSNFPIVARIRSSNVPSLKVVEKSGLKRRHDLDTSEHLVYALGW